MSEPKRPTQTRNVGNVQLRLENALLDSLQAEMAATGMRSISAVIQTRLRTALDQYEQDSSAFEIRPESLIPDRKTYTVTIDQLESLKLISELTRYSVAAIATSLIKGASDGAAAPRG